MMPYAQVHPKLKELLRSFGPRRKVDHTEHPFWRMRNDGIWELDRPDLVTPNSSGDASPKELRDLNIHGGLYEEDYIAFRRNPRLAWRTVNLLLDLHFPGSYREDILRATGIVEALRQFRLFEADEGELGEERATYDLEVELIRRLKRDPAFRPAVLRAYDDKCAVCAFDVRLAGKPTAVEAAHIHWHADAGPARVRNGLALCTLHHRLFDRGALTLSTKDLTIRVAEDAAGPGFEESLGRFQGKLPRVLPRSDRDLPAPQYLRWHYDEVFRRSL